MINSLNVYVTDTNTRVTSFVASCLDININEMNMLASMTELHYRKRSPAYASFLLRAEIFLLPSNPSSRFVLLVRWLFSFCLRFSLKFNVHIKNLHLARVNAESVPEVFHIFTIRYLQSLIKEVH